jgi:UDP-2,3-diacylglucosamine pyrophosphatase LpxH
MILLLGDIHGDWTILKSAIAKAERSNAKALIQLGDFGLFRGNEKSFYLTCMNSPLPIYFIDGNHDDCTRWNTLDQITQVFPEIPLFYVPRGHVMELDGRTVAFMGGAGSIDKDMRMKFNWHWDERENIYQEEIDRLSANTKGKNIDLFLTHCPPNSVIEKHFDPKNKLQFGVGLDWKDKNQDVIEKLWNKLNKPKIYSGHMHKKVVGKDYRILNINELLAV